MLDMLDMLVQLFFGWPGILASLAFSLAGIVSRQFMFAIIGSVLAIPISLYLGATPKFGYFMMLLPLFQFGSAYFIRRGWLKLAWFLLLPFGLTVLWLAMIVLQQR